MKNQYFNIEVRVAITAIVAIILLFFGLKFLKGIDVFKSTRTYYIVFSDVTGLAKSNPIFANGYAVGNVQDIIYDYSKPGRVVVRAELSKEMQIPRGTTAELEASMLGSVSMRLLLSPNPVDHLRAGDTIYGHPHEGALQKVETMMPALESMMPKLDSILTTLNALLQSPAIAQSLGNTAAITANLRESSAQLNTLLARDIPHLARRIDSIGANTERLTYNLSQIDIQPTLDNVNRTVESVNSFTSSLNAKVSGKDNSLGLLLNDRGLYDNLNTTMGSANSLLTDLKEHPKRYVHFSVFGKKDK